MPKADFISNEWQSLLERAARAAGGFANLESQFFQLRSDLMASYEQLKAEVDETLSGIKTVVAKLGEVNAELKAAQEKLASGQLIDYSELTSKLDAAQAEIAAVVAPAEKLPEEAPPVEVPPAEPTL